MQRESFINNEIATRLLERLDYITTKPTVIADHSAENTVVASDLLQRYPMAKQTHTSERAEMIIAHAHLLQETDPQAWFIRMHQQLVIQGLFLFSSVGPDTFAELRACVDTLSFPDMHDLGDALVSAGFVDPVMEAERITLRYDELPMLVHEVNELSLLPMPLRVEQLAWLPKNTEGSYQLTVEVVYGHAWKPVASAMKNGEARISVESLRRRS